MKKKILSLFLSVLFVFNSTIPIFAINPIVGVILGSVAASKGIELIYKGGKYVWVKHKSASQAKKRKHFKGF